MVVLDSLSIVSSPIAPSSSARPRIVRRVLLSAVAMIVVCLAFPGRPRANVQEQRARLPPPATCQDPVEGIWKSHALYPNHGIWHIFTLTVRRDPQNRA